MSLDDSYRRCREITRRAGSTFFWAARLLRADQRPDVHALYAFARTADDIVDRPGPDPAADLREFGARFFADLELGASDDPILGAVVRTVRRRGIDPEALRRFLGSMEMDLAADSYATWDDLLVYMDGSAAAIGEMMLPILEPVDLAAATPPARALGFAFQLTNFLRDIDEDLDRGRQYLPQEDLRRFGVDLTERSATPDFVRLMRFESARCRDLYASAETGVLLLRGRSRRCVRAAHALYARLLDRIEEHGFDVFTRRVSLGRAEKLTIVGRELTG